MGSRKHGRKRWCLQAASSLRRDELVVVQKLGLGRLVEGCLLLWVQKGEELEVCREVRAG
jgi:hypothetical protein